MPYINDETKFKLQSILDNEEWVTDAINTRSGLSNPGELNYMLTTICRNYAGDKYNYERLNAIVGALECCKLEFVRRMVSPYEDKKIAENGDVY